MSAGAAEVILHHRSSTDRIKGPRWSAPIRDTSSGMPRLAVSPRSYALKRRSRYRAGDARWTVRSWV